MKDAPNPVKLLDHQGKINSYFRVFFLFFLEKWQTRSVLKRLKSTWHQSKSNNGLVGYQTVQLQPFKSALSSDFPAQDWYNISNIELSIVLDARVSIVTVAKLVDIRVTGDCRCPRNVE